MEGLTTLRSCWESLRASTGLPLRWTRAWLLTRGDLSTGTSGMIRWGWAAAAVGMGAGRGERNGWDLWRGGGVVTEAGEHGGVVGGFGSELGDFIGGEGVGGDEGVEESGGLGAILFPGFVAGGLEGGEFEAAIVFGGEVEVVGVEGVGFAAQGAEDGVVAFGGFLELGLAVGLDFQGTLVFLVGVDGGGELRGEGAGCGCAGEEGEGAEIAGGEWGWRRRGCRWIRSVS